VTLLRSKVVTTVLLVVEALMGVQCLHDASKVVSNSIYDTAAGYGEKRVLFGVDAAAKMAAMCLVIMLLEM